MGKKKRNAKRGDKRQRKQNPTDEQDSEIEYSCDTTSIYTATTSTSTATSSSGAYSVTTSEDDIEAEEEEVVDEFESKLELVLEAVLTTKSATLRTAHLNSLATALSTRYCSEYLDNRQFALRECIERGLKKCSNSASGSGTTEECSISARILCLTMLTCGELGEEVFQQYYDSMERVLVDTGLKAGVRVGCALALGLGCLLTDIGVEKRHTLLPRLISLAQAPTRPPTIDPLLPVTCLNLYALLAPLEFRASSTLTNQINVLRRLLQSASLEVRLAGGQCLALLYQEAVEEDPEFELDTLDDLCDEVKGLATESGKAHSKKDQRAQRASFRAILRSLEDGGTYPTPEVIKFSSTERLNLDTWFEHLLYSTLRIVLGPGLPHHLTHNPLVRDLFNLGPVPLTNTATRRGAYDIKAAKLEQAFYHESNRRTRQIARGKQQRAKRAALQYSSSTFS